MAMFEAEQNIIEEKIKQFLTQQNIPVTAIQWNRIPFSAHWGISTSFFQIAAVEVKRGMNVIVGTRAQQLAQMVADFLGMPSGFEKIEAVRGYLNLYFSSSEYTRRVIDTVLQQGNDFGRGTKKDERVMVEFSQPNTHKAFHVGHLRNVFLGDAVCRMLDFAGYDVVRANYIGDSGLHVIKWFWNYLKRHSGEVPGVDKTRWMGDLYCEADKYFEHPEAEAEVRALFGRWDRHDADIVKLWQETRQWSLEGFDQIYQMLGITFDRIYYESEEEEHGKEMVNELIKRGIARDERPEGAVIVPLDEIIGSKEKYRVLVILRSDGTSLYSSKDLALAVKKNKEYDLTRSIYVIDVRQSLYMQQIFKTLELMGYQWANRCYHLAYEIVNLPGNVTMSSREGTVVLLEDLVREATNRAMQIVQVKSPELPVEQQQAVANAVALGAIKYSMLSRDSAKIVTFDWEAALDFNGQAAPYIQYAYVRAGSILRKSGIPLPESLTPIGELMPVEIELVELISRLPEEVQRAGREYRPLYIANLAYELARVFNDFYNQCPVLHADEPSRNVRLRLVAAARQAIGNALSTMGIIAPKVM